MTAADDAGRERSRPSKPLRLPRRPMPAWPVRWSGPDTAMEGWRSATIHAVALALTAAIGVADASGGAAISLSALYLVPVVLVAWRLGPRHAVVWSAVAAATWLGAQAALGASAAGAGAAGAGAGTGPAGLSGAIYWNALGQLAIFLVVALTVSALRSFADHTRALAGTDHLTGVLDGRSFQELVELERSRTLRYNRPFTLAYLDVDRLRAVNDLRGHTTGDRTLQLVARTIRENVRSMDSVSRLGGDEFGLLFPETGRGAAEVALGKIRACLDDVVRQRDLPITFSVGAVICVGAPESVDRLILRADALMYGVKERGGDGIAVEVLDDQFGIEAILQRS